MALHVYIYSTVTASCLNTDARQRTRPPCKQNYTPSHNNYKCTSILFGTHRNSAITFILSLPSELSIIKLNLNEAQKHHCDILLTKKTQRHGAGYHHVLHLEYQALITSAKPCQINEPYSKNLSSDDPTE